ncbi:uncharacterized protein BYT42DRAFT_609938 [Radiomyces spectabilis]|uniref:uncharacterized protein n=1 Tax=Radiomyces spectabilis TaxID=64574 RepID=UPI00221F51B7|nr:uncharacterized protein BYT42DRAFT_609938 [Radiomyces spectabilis]KAI8394203.1 hypothetical protein BYT42DRAFT_609938 [Radiomyces spectabilis]
MDSSTSTIYVGNLDQRVTDAMLQEIFATVGPVVSVKIVSARRQGSYSYGGVNYGFVDYADPRVAEQALMAMNGRKIFNYEIKVNWAQQGGPVKENTADHFHVFVGDLAPEITNEMLQKAFAGFGTLSDAHVMWDSVSGKSRGFGFVAFRDKADAEQAIATMNGEWLGSRAIRCNWATQKGQTATPPPQPGQQLPYEVAVHQTPAYVTSVYVGNLPPTATQNDIMAPFQRFGFVQEVKLQVDRGFAFVKMDTHENAANAIVQLQNMDVHGRPAKLSWGKDRPPAGWHSYPQQHWNNGHQLYAGRVNNRHDDSRSQLTNGSPFMSAAPNSLASLDPHAGGTQAAQWGQQQPLYDQYHAGASNV